jgi:hypothetical protein
MKLTKIVKHFRVDRPKKFRLADIDPADTCGLDIDKAEAKAIIATNIQQLAHRQEMLYAHNRWAVLAIFQAMDAAGKDSAIKHVMSGINPQGCQVFAFKAPSAEELGHDFLWRTNVRLPERGRKPFRRQLIAESERQDLDLRPLALQHSRDTIQKRAPLLLIKLANRHGNLLSGCGNFDLFTALAPRRTHVATCYRGPSSSPAGAAA